MPTDILARSNVNVFGLGTQLMLFARGFGCNQNMWRDVTPGFEHSFKDILADYLIAPVVV